MPIKTVVYSSPGGSPLKSKIEWSRKMVSMFRPKERNAILRKQSKMAAYRWRAKNLRKRFSASVIYGPPYNYNGSRRRYPLDSKRRKMGDPDKMKVAVYRGSIKVRVGGKKKAFQVTVAMPFGHAVLPKVSRVMHILPPDEVQEYANDMEKVLTEILEKGGGAKLVKTKTKYPKTLNARQRRLVGV